MTRDGDSTNINTQIGRLALRQEGGQWNAYYAQPGTMKDAAFLGSIKMAFIVDNPDRKTVPCPRTPTPRATLQRE